MTDVYLPLYEAKMLSFFDHRAADVVKSATAQHRQNQPRYLTDEEKDDPNREAIGLYWVDSMEVVDALGSNADAQSILSWSKVTSSTNARTFLPTLVPSGGAGDSNLLVMDIDAKARVVLAGVWSSLVADYVARQKLSGVNLNFWIISQVSMPTPVQIAESAPWVQDKQVADCVARSVRELSYTSWGMAPFARELGDDGPPFRWIPVRREQIRAELDAMVFHVYGLDRDEVDYVLDTFTVLRKYDERDYGEFRTKRLILEFYDLLADAIASGTPYRTPINPPPGSGPRHPESTRPQWIKEP